MSSSNQLEKAKLCLDALKSNRSELVSLLSEFESIETANEEIDGSIHVLSNIQDKMKQYFNGQVGPMAVFLPLNLPLYSLVLYVIVPKFQTERVIVRPPSCLMQIVPRIWEVSGFDKIFNTHTHKDEYKCKYKEIEFSALERSAFIKATKDIVDVITFTGAYANALKVHKRYRSNSLFIFNGSGSNPFVVGPNCDLVHVVESAVSARLFNSGQDCCAPSAIIVHESVVDAFITELKSKLSTVKVGLYSDGATVGPVIDPARSMVSIVKLLTDHRRDIVYGGMVDVCNSIIHPCVILTKESSFDSDNCNYNFNEVFAPIFWVHTYSSPAQLERYFKSSEYRHRAMYVSVFGDVKDDDKDLFENSVVLRNMSALDHEDGTKEFGGWGREASFIWIDEVFLPKPILIPREIDTYLIQRASETDPLVVHRAERMAMIASFKEEVQRVFGDLLLFAFVTGSSANGTFSEKSDLNTFVCLKEKEKASDEMVKQMLRWIFRLHIKHGLRIDPNFPMELMTIDQLRANINIDRQRDVKFDSLQSQSLSQSVLPSDLYDVVAHSDQLAGPKAGVVGDTKALNSLAREFAVRQSVSQWKEEVLNVVLELGSSIQSNDQSDGDLNNLTDRDQLNPFSANPTDWRPSPEAPTVAKGLSSLQSQPPRSSSGLRQHLKAIPFRQISSHFVRYEQKPSIDVAILNEVLDEVMQDVDRS